MSQLTPEHYQAMADVAAGADVYAYGKACLLREVERLKPEYIRIVRAKNAPSGEYQQPYFGAVLTAQGFEAVKTAEFHQKTRYTMTDTTETIPAGYREDAAGRLVPEDSVRPIDLMRDDLVRDIAHRAEQLREQLRKFKEDTLSELAAFVETSAAEYNVKLGGTKGNLQLTSYDGKYRVLRANHDSMTFDERLLAAKELIDECLRDWSGRPGVPNGLVVIANKAFRRNAAGEISVSRVLDLRSHDIDDERWQRAMEIITDSIRVQASITYLRIYKRKGRTDQYEQLSLDIAGV